MESLERFKSAIRGEKVDRLPVLPKIWVASACEITGQNPLRVCECPNAVLEVVVEASEMTQSDGARLFLFPRRKLEIADGKAVEYSLQGHLLGKVDMEGGWTTSLENPQEFDITKPEWMAYNHYYPAGEAAYIERVEDVKAMAVPTAEFWEAEGFAESVQALRQEVGSRIALIGDCDTATLAFMTTLRGMGQVMMDLISDPGLVEATFQKGLEICLERARFWLRQGIKILRFNDSMANMSVISPDHWRQFVFPVFKEFCAEVHRMDREALVYCHICGNVLPVLEDLKATGLDCIGPMDPLGGFSVQDARSVVGNETALMGGVNTMTMLSASPEAVREEALECMKQNGGHTGFVLGTGCVTPPATPKENMVALSEASQIFADSYKTS